MYDETDTNDHGLRDNPLKASVVPRPIGWLTTVDAAGVHEADGATKGSPVHFECRLHQVVTLPGRTSSAEHQVLFGRVVAVHIDDAALTADGRIDLFRIRPIARLGYKDYTSIESTFQMEKPTPEDSLQPR